jgi:hypothetical protein
VVGVKKKAPQDDTAAWQAGYDMAVGRVLGLVKSYANWAAGEGKAATNRGMEQIALAMSAKNAAAVYIYAEISAQVRKGRGQ